MEMVTLTKKPSSLESVFLTQLLTKDDLILLSGHACVLALQAPFFEATCVIRTTDAERLGGKINDGWLAINNSQWVKYVEQANKNTVW